MDAKKIFYITLIISTIVQFVTLFIEIGAYFVKIPSTYYLISQLLSLELFVQFIEGSFYLWLAYNLTKVTNVTPRRYIDWVITTPTMLLTLMMYLIYLNKKQEEKHELEELEFFKLCQENSTVFITVLLLNWAMLFFGYLGEIKRIPVVLGAFLGFVPFLIYYYIIYVNFVTPSGYLLFWYFFFFWSLYGFVAVLPYYLKNACYNILDLFSKNFFGILLSYIIFSGNY